MHGDTACEMQQWNEEYWIFQTDGDISSLHMSSNNISHAFIIYYVFIILHAYEMNFFKQRHITRTFKKTVRFGE